MKTALAAIVLVLANVAAPAVRAQSDPHPPPRVSFSITGSQVILRSLDGGLLPLAVSEQRQHLLVRSYDGVDGEFLDSEPDPSQPLSVEASHNGGLSRIEIDHVFGDVRATASADDTAAASFNDIIWGSGATFTLPARSYLTMVAWVGVHSDADWNSNYISFERGLIPGTEGATGERFILDGAEASSQYFITALNPLDQAATFYYYSTLYANAYNVSAVPEPGAWAMLAGGLLLAACRRARRRPVLSLSA